MKDNKNFNLALQQLFNTYDKIGSGQPSSYFVFNDKTSEVHSVSLSACHYGMRVMSPNKWDRLVTAVPRSAPADITYLQMLINGPFRGLSHLVHLKSVDGLWYLECTDLNQWPANVLYNFCIASRAPIEYPKVVRYMAELVAKHYDPTLAFLIAATNNGNPLKQGAKRAWEWDHHIWIDTSSDWSLVLKGTPIKLSADFKTYPDQSSPCNVIWGKSNDYAKAITMSDEAIAEFYGLVPKPPVEPPVKKKLSVQDIMAAMAAADHVVIQNGVQVDNVQWADNVQLAPGAFVAVPAWAQQGLMPAPPHDFDDDDDFEDFNDDDDGDEFDDDDF